MGYDDDYDAATSTGGKDYDDSYSKDPYSGGDFESNFEFDSSKLWDNGFGGASSFGTSFEKEEDKSEKAIDSDFDLFGALFGSKVEYDANGNIKSGGGFGFGPTGGFDDGGFGPDKGFEGPGGFGGDKDFDAWGSGSGGYGTGKED